MALVFLRNLPVRLLDKTPTHTISDPQRTQAELSICHLSDEAPWCVVCVSSAKQGIRMVSLHVFLFLVEETLPWSRVQHCPFLLSAAVQIYKSHRSSALVWHKTSRAGHVTHKVQPVSMNVELSLSCVSDLKVNKSQQMLPQKLTCTVNQCLEIKYTYSSSRRSFPE